MTVTQTAVALPAHGSTKAKPRLRRRRDVVAPSRFRRFSCNGVHIDACGADEAVGALLDLALQPRGAAVHLCNAYVVALAQRDADYRELLNRAQLNLADGTPVAWVGRFLRTGLTAPSRGADLMLETLRRGVPLGIRHYFYGASTETVARLRTEIQRQVPGVIIVGAESPPYRALDDAEKQGVVRRLVGSEAHVVWVGLGTPRQDVFVDEFQARVDAAFVPVGAAFDFLAGTKAQAPTWLRGTGLEWLHRLATEPRRLLGRYLRGNTRFVAGLWRSRAVVVPGVDRIAAVVQPSAPLIPLQLTDWDIAELDGLAS
ncbi:MAG: N-acetylglucosaminyldiphosphoundecaprenol N-acetyl-beta-D-mannosaminyltransferase [Actinomycetota bacterium]|jgi:N-acetylglucosaminyldiphosphoundecaprenol N-acetyl-beta-D-mannosaminyltransferase|nr:N-acetylglucosaminyldiphosphoundecaprenol N-acetyl-beta-D-mannosaminyltransferase [Actinomycetota bacterium]